MIASVFSWLYSLLTAWYIWLPIVAVLGYLTFRNYRRAKHVAGHSEHILLILEIPKANDKKELAAEQMFASLHGILRDKRELALEGGMQEHISFEFAAIHKQIRFYVWVPRHLQNFLEGQIYAQYPTVQIHEADEDYTQRDLPQEVIYTSELTLVDNEVLPIKTFQSFEVDPLAGVTATLSKLEDPNEEMWIQVTVRPIADDWHRRAARYVSTVKNGGLNLKSSSDVFSTMGIYLLRGLAALWKPPEDKPSAPKDLSEREKTRISEVEKKSTKLGYQVKIRLAYLGNDQPTAKLRMQAIVGTFKQFNSTNLNGFRMQNASFSHERLAELRARFFIDKGYILNIEELASVYHLPHTNVETPSIVWASAKTAEPPAKLPVLTGDPATDDQISAFGLTNFRGMKQQFGIERGDRGRHIYVIGQTGAGKSGLLQLLALSDIFHNQGFAIIDPHGDLAVDVMRFVPSYRIEDVVYFNPADTAFPIGFNPMEVINPNMKSNISSEIIGVLKRMFGESWGPRLEYILRYTILALLDYPNTTMLDITRMLTDKKFREKVLAECKDTVVLNFWRIEFASWNDKFMAEAVAPVLNKVGAFVANPIIRNIIGQPKSTFSIREIMDQGKILIVNLSKGLIGEDNAGILGAFLVTKVQLAAMSRSDIPRLEDRRPFYLYVDEFQNFATDSFASIRSEARKFSLNLTVANQYVSQMQPTVRDAVFGNVGTTISFRVSADDAPLLAKPFAPLFVPEDLLSMHNRNFIISMVIKGEKAPGFTGTTLLLPAAQTDYSPNIVENTRHNYALSRSDVEAEIHDLIAVPTHLQPKQGGGGGGSSPQPQSKNLAKLWPATGITPERPVAKTAPAAIAPQPTTKPEPNNVSSPAHGQPQPEQSTPESNNALAPARKRSRSRSRSRSRKSSGGGESQTPQQQSAAPRPGQSSAANDHELRLR